MITDRHADLVFTGGGVYTVDAARRWADAVAVRGDTIVAVGTKEHVAPQLGPRTQMIDLEGRMLLPGFQDAHIHAPSGGLDRLRVDLSGVRASDEYRELIQAYANANPEEEWILGGGWWSGVFPGGAPTRKELDHLVPDRPAFISDSNNHAAWVNSRALQIAGIDAGSPDPVDGRIEREPSGEPLGTLIEGAMDLVRRVIPATSLEMRVAGLLEGQAYLHSLGITAWQDAIVGSYATIEDNFDAYLDAVRRDALSARVVGALWFERGRGLEQLPLLEDRRDRGRVDRFRATTVKIMADGGCENHSAAMLEPYLKADGMPSDNVGIEFFDADELREAIVALDAAGFQVHVHVLGDKACRSALDGLEAARNANGPNDHRHHLAHVQIVHPQDLPRLRALGIVANVQPLWAAHGPAMDDLVIPFLGEPRASWQFPFGSLARSGVRLAMGSDWPITSANPLWGIHVAVNRVLPSAASSIAGAHTRQPYLPSERLDLPTAIAAATIGSAYVNHLDDVTGSIEVGKLADLVVLDRNVFEAPPGEIADATALLTLVGGEPVFESMRL
jgi:predicted amidohydrolase YtcJ